MAAHAITDRNARPSVYTKNCLTRAVLDRIADKWTTLIIGLLASGKSLRFTELSRAIDGISQKMLSQTLRELERDGLVTRRVHAVVPPRVEYSLTPLGLTLCGPLHALADWAEEHMRDIRDAQRRFDRRIAEGERGALRPTVTP